MYDDADDTRKANILYWGLRVFYTDPDLFACWCAVDDTNMPWALGLFDEDFSRTISIYGRHGALITAPAMTFRDLPVGWADFSDAGWREGLCLTVEHYSGLDTTFKQYADGSGSVYLSAHAGCDGEPFHVTVPDAVIAEYLTCTTVDPTRWHERPGWVRNPRPYNRFEADHLHYQQTGDVDWRWSRAQTDQWFDTVKDELAHRRLAAH